MTERLKLRHKVTGEEKGPYWGMLEATWITLWTTQEYDFIRSSDCYDRHGNEIFEGDMASYMGTACPDRGREWPRWLLRGWQARDVTSEWSAYAEIVGRNGALCNW
jgi:hypothetical protein